MAIDKISGLWTQVTKLKKRLSELDTAKADPIEVRNVADALERLEKRLEAERERKKQRQIEKENKEKEQQNQIESKEEAIPGGLAKGKPDSDFDKEQLEKGTKHEMEHTGDPEVAKEIAKDHLVEDSKYYDKMEEMEKESSFETLAEVEPIKGTPGSFGKVLLHDKDANIVYVKWEGGKLATKHGYGGYDPKDLKKKASLVRDPDVELNVGTKFTLVRSVMAKDGIIYRAGTEGEIVAIEGDHIHIKAGDKTFIINKFDSPKMFKTASKEEPKKEIVTPDVFEKEKKEREEREKKYKEKKKEMGLESKKRLSARDVKADPNWKPKDITEVKEIDPTKKEKIKKQLDYLQFHASKKDNMKKEAKNSIEKYKQYYQGFDETIDKPEGGVGAHVYEFPNEKLVEEFLAEIGGVPHPLGGNRVIVAQVEGPSGIGFGGDRPGIAVAPKRDEDVSLRSQLDQNLFDEVVHQYMQRLMKTRPLGDDQAAEISNEIREELENAATVNDLWVFSPQLAKIYKKLSSGTISSQADVLKEASFVEVANRKWEVVPTHNEVGEFTGYDIFTDLGQPVMHIKPREVVNIEQLKQIIFDELGKHSMLDATLKEDVAILKKGHKVKIVKVDRKRNKVKFVSAEKDSVSGWAEFDKFDLEADVTVEAYISHEGDEWCVRSRKNPSWSGGCYPTKEQAEKRLQQVEMFKHMDSSLKEKKPINKELLAKMKENCPSCYAKFIKFAKEKGLKIEAEQEVVEPTVEDQIAKIRERMDNIKSRFDTITTEALLKKEGGIDLFIGDEYLMGMSYNTLNDLKKILPEVGNKLEEYHIEGKELSPSEVFDMMNLVKAFIGKQWTNLAAATNFIALLNFLELFYDKLLSGAERRKSIKVATIKTAGEIAGPGIPDGTGPFGGTEKCPMSEKGKHPIEEPAVKELIKWIELDLDMVENSYRDKPEVIQHIEKIENDVETLESMLGLEDIEPVHEMLEPEHKEIEKEEQFRSPKPTTRPPEGFEYAYDPVTGTWVLVAKTR